jgi:hypothetical protein
MVGTKRSPAPAPPRGATVDIFYIDGGRSQISVSTRQGAYHQHFFALMMGALGSLAPPPRGATMSSTFISKKIWVLTLLRTRKGSYRFKLPSKSSK